MLIISVYTLHLHTYVLHPSSRADIKHHTDHLSISLLDASQVTDHMRKHCNCLLYVHRTHRALRTSVAAVLTESRAAQAAETSTLTSTVPPSKPPYIIRSTTSNSTGMYVQNNSPHVHPHFFHGLSAEVQAMLLEVHSANRALFLGNSNSNSTNSVTGGGVHGDNSVAALSRASNTGNGSKATSHHSKVCASECQYLHAL
jgi:hypothetical protein